MGVKRRHLSLTVKLASALLQIRDKAGQPCIPWEDSKLMSAAQINSLWEWDHYPIRHEAGGPDEPWNVVPRLIMLHRTKTAMIDLPEVSKIRRVTAAEEAFRTRLLAKAQGEEKPKSRWPSRPMGRRR